MGAGGGRDGQWGVQKGEQQALMEHSADGQPKTLGEKSGNERMKGGAAEQWITLKRCAAAGPNPAAMRWETRRERGVRRPQIPNQQTRQASGSDTDMT